MAASLNSITDPSDLLKLADAKVPYRFDQIFQARGFGAKRLERKRLKLMKEIDSEVQRLLAPGEKIHFVSWGVDYSFVEQYVMGPWAHRVSRRALVFTDRRILALQISARRKLRDSKAQLRYPAIQSVPKKTYGYLGLVLQNGKRIQLTGIPRRDRKAIEILIDAKLAAGRTAAPVMVGLENLCPRCGHRVLGLPKRCGQCAQSFKSGGRAGWLSLVLPGLGDLYLGHRALGLFAIVCALLAWVLVALPLAWMTWGRTGSWIEPAAIVALAFALIHGTASWITRRMGSKALLSDD